MWTTNYIQRTAMKWESYREYSKELGFTYDDDMILESIKRTHHLVQNRVEDFEPDEVVFCFVPEGKTDAQALVGLYYRTKGLASQQHGIC